MSNAILNTAGSMRAGLNKWLSDAALAVDPLRGATTPELSFRRKCLNELAVYLLWLDHLGVGRDDESDRLRATCKAFITDDYIDVACRSPKRILMFSSALAFALRECTLDSIRRERISQHLSGPFAWHSELPAFRQLDLLVACRFGEIHEPISAPDVMLVSSVVLPPCPIYGDRDAFYALAHSIVYSEMLGLRVPIGPRLRESLDGALCRAVVTEDLDLGIELLLASMVLGIETTPAMMAIMNATLQGLTAGALQCPAIQFEAIADFLAVCPQEQAWANAFHLMVVAGMLLAFLETRRSLPELPSEGRRAAFVENVGATFAALHHYRFASGITHALRLAPETELETAHVRRIADFVRCNQYDEHHYGLLVEERAVFERTMSGRNFETAVRAPLNDLCLQFLTQTQRTA